MPPKRKAATSVDPPKSRRRTAAKPKESAPGEPPKSRQRTTAKPKESASVEPPKSRRRTAAKPTQPPPTLAEQTSKLQLASVSSTDPLAKLDDLCLDLVFRQLELQDLAMVCGVSQLWRMRSTYWVVNSARRAKELGLVMPKGIDVDQEPVKFADAWRRNALRCILRETGKPPRAIKLSGVAYNVWGISYPYVAWIESERLKYQWSAEYVGGVEDEGIEGPSVYMGFQNAWLYVQRPVSPANMNTPIPKARRTSFQSIFTANIRQGRTENYQPSRLRVWTSSDGSRVIGILDASICNPVESSISRARNPIISRGGNNGKGEFVTVFIDLSSFKVLWHIDQNDNPRWEMFYNGVESTISDSGRYTMVRGLIAESGVDRTYLAEVSVYNILTGELIFRNEIPRLFLRSIYRTRHGHWTSWIQMHPSHDAVFLCQEDKQNLVVTPTGHYTLPDPPIIQFNLNEPYMVGPKRGGSGYGQTTVSFESSTSSGSTALNVMVILPARIPTKNTNQVVFTYELPADPSTAGEADWADLKLVRIRTYAIPKEINLDSYGLDLRVNPQLNQLVCQNHSGYRIQSTAMVFTWIPANLPADRELKVAECTGREGDKAIPIEFWKTKKREGVPITTRRKTPATKKRKGFVGGNFPNLPLGGEETGRKPVVLPQTQRLAASVEERWAAVSGDETVVLAFF